MSNSPTYQDLEEHTQPLGIVQVRSPVRSRETLSPVSELNPHMFLAPQNRAYLALTVASVIALIAFFMPYFTVSTVVSGTSTFLNIPLSQSSPLPTAGSDAANGFPWLWLVLLVAVVDITVSAVIVLDSNSLHATVPPIVGACIFLITGLAGFAVLLASIFRANGDISSVNQLLSAHATYRYHVILGIGPGFWLSLLAMLCIAILGGIGLRRAWQAYAG